MMQKSYSKIFKRGGAFLIGIGAVLGLGWILTRMIVWKNLKPYSPEGEMVCTSSGTCLHAVVRGAGPPLVLLHGDGGTISDWELSVLDDLSEEYQVIALDRPGFGFSPLNRPGTRPIEQVELIREVLQELKVEDPILMGHSRGGNLALVYGLLHPEGVQGIVTVAAAPYGGTVGWHSRLLTTPGIGPLLAHTWGVPPARPLVRAGLDSAFGPAHATPEEYLEVYAAFELRPGQLLAHARDQVWGREKIDWMTARYQELSVPLVILHSADDQNVPFDQALMLHESAPCSRLLELSDAGHEIMFTRPDLVTFGLEMLENFPGPHAEEEGSGPGACSR
jgi:pimeloyl-ACP methyl ester carboxylesterase